MCQSISKCCFKECENLEKVKISHGSKLERIEEEAFCKTKIKKIFLPSSIRFLGEKCFDECSELKKIEFSEESKFDRFEMNYFESCSRKLVIKLPRNFKSLDNIPKHILFNLDLSSSDEIFIDGDYIYEDRGKRLIHIRSSGQSKIVIREGVVEISENIFKDLECVKEVEAYSGEKFVLSDFPKSVERITLSKMTEKFVGDEFHENLKVIIVSTNYNVIFTNCENLPQDLVIISETPDFVVFKKLTDKRKVVNQRFYDSEKKKLSNSSGPRPLIKSKKEDVFDFSRLEKVKSLGR